MFKIKDFEPRLYQQMILDTCSRENTLVVLPTGLGKTKIGIMTSIQRLNKYPNSKILFLTPTKPLVNQIFQEFKNNTDVDEINLFTGEISPKKREELWKNSKIIISTPQGVENDIINDSINLKEVSLLILDEAHRAVKDYSYTWIAKQYHKKANYERIVGLTASPGSDLETVTEVCNNLFTKEIESRTEEDPDVKQYVQDINIDWIKIDLPEELKEIKNYLEYSLKSKLEELKKFGYTRSTSDISKKDLLSIQSSLQGQIARGEKDFQIFRAVSISAEAIKTNHAIELLETQGIKSVYNYLKSIFESNLKSKAVKNLIQDLNFKSAYIKSKLALEKNVVHPKEEKLIELVKNEIENNKNVKIMVFNQYRDSAQEIEKKLNKLDNIHAKLFVGQAKKNGTGLTQKEQISIIKDFENSIYNCLISTSIGEEGLDIPKVDLVIFYEPVPSAIRYIQRKGRTARHSSGRLIVLMTKNTRDEAYHWTAFHKEKRMHRLLLDLKNKIKISNQPTLKEYMDEKKESELIVYADNREGASGVIKYLNEIGMNVRTRTLTTADFVLSKRVGVERKTKKDFVDSIIDKRLLHQIKDLKNNFERPLLILEGEEDIYSLRNIHPNAIRGMLATIAISYGIPIIQTKNFQETAEIIKAITNREQNYEEKDIGVRTEKKPMTTKEQQEFIIESLPNIGPSLAKSLLKEFKTVKKIINAKPEKLIKIDQLGQKKAGEIKRVLDEIYEDENV
ncbi:DEAD/DEAH box helicase [Candidatus Woesearchaeota archaeon]|nr:DEAD/DEAH box helicase [Candidatus Woesearchaeota archaeon]